MHAEFSTAKAEECVSQPCDDPNDQGLDFPGGKVSFSAEMRFLTMDDIVLPKLDPVVREAFDVPYSNIYAFHDAQKVPERTTENMRMQKNSKVHYFSGPLCSWGTAVLPSTALMLSVPAQIAGCKTIVLATPPGRDGSICKEVLYCAKKAGVTHILKAGGAQAIAAMAWGTASCTNVEKIFGLGNQYVTAAKMILQVCYQLFFFTKKPFFSVCF